ncbi:protein of unknown function [Thermococcus nautili]|nr:protein of unknown function [Thermococcus nautili]
MEADKRGGGRMRLSILLESYCNEIMVSEEESAGPLSILLESYCNRHKEEVHTGERQLSILLESYCNSRLFSRARRECPHFQFS